MEAYEGVWCDAFTAMSITGLAVFGPVAFSLGVDSMNGEHQGQI
jgi:hypothetical protein